MIKEEDESIDQPVCTAETGAGRIAATAAVKYTWYLRERGRKGSWKSLNHSQVLEYSKSSEALVRLDSRVAHHGFIGR